jgi:hypothetical protein
MRTLLATLCAFGAIAAPAAAQATATATPNGTGKGARIHTTLDATQPPVSGRLPAQTVLSVQPGFTLDLEAVAKRCTAAQAGRDACPAKSKIGSAVVRADYQGTPITVPIALYLAKPAQAGDLAGFEAVAQLLGTHAVAGRIVRSATGTSIILPTPGGNAISGFGATFESFTSDFGVSRVVRKKVHHHVRKRRHYLIRTPATCPGSWSSNAAFTFGDGTTAQIDAPIACVE